MDWWSQRLANHLLGNPETAATIELTLSGTTVECEVSAHLALTGARMSVAVDDDLIESPFVLDAGAGTVIQVLECMTGTRAYLAVEGGFDVPLVLGSRSTDLRAGFGGYAGRALRPGDRVPFGEPACPRGTRSITRGSGSARARCLPEAAIAPDRRDVAVLRVLPAVPQHPAGDRVVNELAAASFRVSSRSDRMGYRLEGSSSLSRSNAALITAPTTMGLVQLPPSGEPILLMADRQTTGGYASVGVVITADLPVAGQLAPGDALRFEPCSRDVARQALEERAGRLSAYETWH
jgi:biotin-dependent carboxylase-like uncharacterized protein